MIYSSNKVTVNSSTWTEIIPAFDFSKWSLYPIDGDIIVQLRAENAWGSTIYGFEGIPLGTTLDIDGIRIKAVGANVEVAYFLAK